MPLDFLQCAGVSPNEMSGPEWVFSAESEWGPAADVAVVGNAKDDEESIGAFVFDQVAD
jgi:hypothetical protein